MEPPFDLSRAHRWFAIEGNNQAWELIEREGGPGADEDRLLHMAHMSVWHWGEVGTPVNRLRGLVLLVNAYLAVGRGNEAIRYAEECRTLAAQKEIEATIFDQATATQCLAHAQAVAGDPEVARSLRAEAIATAEGLQDPRDRAVFDAIVARSDWSRLG